MSSIALPVAVAVSSGSPSIPLAVSLAAAGFALPFFARYACLAPKCTAFGRGLTRWCEEAQGTPEHAGRLEAAKRIQVCYVLKESDLNLGNLQLSSLPPQISSLTHLEELYADRNQLTAIPPEVFTLSNLHDLCLTSNRITSIPPEISSLCNLQSLAVPGNRIYDCSPEIGRLPRLRTLYLSYNDSLNDLPDEIFGLPRSCYINYNNCPFSDDALARFAAITQAPGYAGPQFLPYFIDGNPKDAG